MTSLCKIQDWMSENDKDIFLINRTDEFLSEFISPYAERLRWISNFSGSAGRAIIEKNKAYIFVDGRYTKQAKKQIDSNYFEIKHLQNYWDHLKKYSKDKKNLCFDTKLHSIIEVKKIKKIFSNSKVSLFYLDKNPIDNIWKDQPLYPNSIAFLHEAKYSGCSSIKKIKEVQIILQSNYINYYLLNSLDSIAWLLNIRGSDIEYTPLLCCYVIIPAEGKISLFINKIKIEPIIKDLQILVNFYPIEKIDTYIESLNNKNVFGMDEKETLFYFKNICNNIGLTTKHLENPCLYPKSVKNFTELEGARKANLRDGVSVTKFLYWLKNNMKVNEINEIKAADFLLNLRKKNQFYYSSSFDTISAFGPNAALPHYNVTKESNSIFKNNSLYLVDSGAQYYDGTTDITRTVIIGIPTEEQKDRFTRVLKGHIAISEAIFPINTKGSFLDPLARKSLKEIGCDYDHGTGHGIGSFLSVHEGPQRIGKSQGQIEGYLKQGMILSNEPGYYKNGEYGIRIENLIICSSKNKENLYFENISWAPIDRELCEVSLLDQNEIKWINEYHQKVYDLISPNLNDKENKWLYSVTRSL